MEMEVDRLSNLPGHIIEDILLRLPIKDAVRTSILSSKWTNKWATLPNLVFDDRSCPVSSFKLVNIIDQVLSLHLGPIQKFKLVRKEPLPFHNMDRWILYLSRTTVQDLCIRVFNLGLAYTIPFCLFSCRNLTRLRLSKCLVRLPPAFRGFATLKSLNLMSVRMSQPVLERLVSSCPALEKLTLWNMFQILSLDIDAPNLKLFRLGCSFMDVAFPNTPRLGTVSIHSWIHGNSMDFLVNLANLPNLHRLDLKTNFINCLVSSASRSPKPLPKFRNLHVLSADINFSATENVSRAIYVLQGAPNLRELDVTSMSGWKTDAGIWEAGHGTCTFLHLRLMKLTQILGLPNEMDFVKYMLSNSPALESMVIVPDGGCTDKWTLVKELLSFKRASANAQIIFLDS